MHLTFKSSSPREGDDDGNDPESANHTVVATARGVFDSSGGVLESPETGVSIIIPKGAIPDNTQQEIYFKVCQDNSILPPLDKEKGTQNSQDPFHLQSKLSLETTHET